MEGDLYKSFLDNIPCPIWIIGIDRRYKYVNEFFKQYHDLHGIDIKDRTIDEVIPEGFRKVFSARLDEIFASKKIIRYETNVKGNYTECYAFPLFDDNKLCAAAGIVIDINARKEKEMEILNQKNILQTIIDTIPDPIFYKDVNSRYVVANQRCKDDLSKMISQNIIGKDDSEIMFDKELAQRFMSDDQEIMKMKTVKYTKPSMTLPSGEVRIKESVKAPVIDGDNNVIGIVGLARDITEQKQMEDRLKYLSYTDILTGLYNRTSFEERIKYTNKEKNLPLGIIMGDVNGLKLINDTFGHLEGDRLLVSIANVLKESCGKFADIYRWGGDEFVIIVPRASEEQCKVIIEDIKSKCKAATDTLIELSISLGDSIQSSPDQNVYDLLKEAEEIVYRHKLLERNSLLSSTVNSLLKTLEAKSFESEQHVERMIQSARYIGDRLNLSLPKIDELILATKLHDIGEIMINENILMKEDKLTEEEYDILKTHPEKGYRIVKASNILETVAEGILSHHERFDGKGYPMGLKGDDIPIIGRIISVIDSYDVMINGRVYKKSISKDEAIKELINCKGKQFDPKVVDCFLDCIKE